MKKLLNRVKSISLFQLGAIFVLSVCTVGFFLRDTVTNVFDLISSLFSGLALLGLIATIRLQQKELSDTRREFKQQNQTMLQQRFETTFFQLRQQQYSLMKSVTAYIGGVPLHGPDAFTQVWKEVEDKVRQVQIVNGKIDREEKNLINPVSDNLLVAKYPLDKEELLISIREVFDSRESSLSDYYRHFFVLLEYVVHCDFELNPITYMNFIRGTMSNSELLCLFYFTLIEKREFSSNKIMLQSSNLYQRFEENLLLRKEDWSLYKWKDLLDYRNAWLDDMEQWDRDEGGH